MAKKSTLLRELADKLSFPDYFGHNWDALDEALSDLSWIKEPEVCIWHMDVPLADSREASTYLKLLKAWLTSPMKNACMWIFPKRGECRSNSCCRIEATGAGLRRLPQDLKEAERIDVFGFVRAILSRSILLIPALIAAACVASTQEPTRPGSAQVQNEDIAILRAVLHDECASTRPGYRVLSDAPAEPGDLKPPLGWQVADLGQQLSVRSHESTRWPHTPLCEQVSVRDREVIEKLFTQQVEVPPSWQPFFSAFEGATALIEISLPALSADRRRAIVYTTYECEATCGSGFFIELRREKHGWKVTRKTGAWIS